MDSRITILLSLSLVYVLTGCMQWKQSQSSKPHLASCTLTIDLTALSYQTVSDVRFATSPTELADLRVLWPLVDGVVVRPADDSACQGQLPQLGRIGHRELKPYPPIEGLPGSAWEHVSTPVRKNVRQVDAGSYCITILYAILDTPKEPLCVAVSPVFSVLEPAILVSNRE